MTKETIEVKDGSTSSDDEEKLKKVKKEKQKKVSLKQLFQFATIQDRIYIVLGAISSAAVGCVMPSFALLFGDITDAFNATSSNFTEKINRIALWIVLIGVGAFIFNIIARYCWIMSSEKQAKTMRLSYLKAILRQDMTFFDLNGTGSLTSRIATDTIIIQEAVGEKFGQCIQYTSTFVFGLIIGFIKGWKLTLVILAASPTVAITGAIVVTVVGKLTTQGQTAYAAAGKVANEMISAVRTVASFNLEEKAEKQYTEKLVDARTIGIKKGLVTGASLGFTYFFIFATYSLSFWYGGRLVASGEYSGGDVLSVLLAVIIASFAIGQASPAMEAVVKGREVAYKMIETINRRPIIDSDSTKGEMPLKVHGDIQLRKAHFTYPSRQDSPVLNGLDLNIPAGKKVALVGPSGCGKSSIISLIQRFYDPIEGEILLDNKDLKSLNVKWLRQQFGLVGQEPVLFSGTIAENIAFGHSEITQEQIETAAKASNAHNFIMSFPNGYDTEVGERGAQLSGGQKQRIAIARAIVKNPKILLLDEATSALDTESEKVVQDALERVMEGRTTIIVAHRLATIKDADIIAVLSKGTVVEMGKHEELMEKQGIYADLVRIQVGTEETDNSGKEAKNAEAETSASQEVELTVQHVHRVVEDDDEKPKGFSLARLFKLNRPETGYLILGVISSLFIGAVNPTQSILLGELLESYYVPRDEVEDSLRPWVLAYLGLAGALLIGYVGQNFFFGIAGQHLIYRCRQMSFRSILRQEIGWFDFKTHSTGVLTARLSSDAMLVEGAVGASLGSIVTCFSAISTALIISFIYGWELAWVMLLCFPLVVMGTLADFLAVSGFNAEKQKTQKLANQVVSESISNIKTVASYTNEDKMVELYEGQLRHPQKLAFRSAKITALFLGVSQFSLMATNAIAIWYGGKLIKDGKLSFSDFIIIYQAIFFAAETIAVTFAVAPNLTQAKSASATIFQLIDRVSKIDSGSTEGIQKPQSEVKGEIKFENVVFTYPTRPESVVLRGLDLTLKAGQVTALVGSSGCGKSSSLGLIERWYDPQSGSITLDGTDIKKYNIKWLRDQIGVVGQEPVLFSGTIAENIACSRPTATKEEIEEAAKAANAYKFISSFPQGFNTEVGEKGTQLSGGQKQRIAIARAIIKRPSILLLDEATSALDSESEKIVQEALDNAMEGRTTLVIAHRLSTIKKANTIYVIHQGKVVEVGNHEELMNMKGAYYKLVNRQTSQH